MTLGTFTDLKLLYKPSAKEPALVNVPPAGFLMVDGEGNPNEAKGFHEAIEALYAVSYTLKFDFKKGPEGIDFRVSPLEALWWTNEDGSFDAERSKEGWRWTAMIMQPDCVTADQVARASEQVARKRNPAALGKVRLELFDEGLAAQIMHVGPYADEAPTIAKLHAFIVARGYLPRGKHHEIYLGDPRRAAPEKLRTVLRQPVAVAASQ